MKKALLLFVFVSFGYLLTAQTLEIIGNGNLRTGPGTTNDVIGKVTIGTKVTQIEFSNDWYKVELPNKSSGWVYKTLVKIDKSTLENLQIPDTLQKPKLRFFSSQNPVWSKNLQGFISPLGVPQGKEILITLNNPDIKIIEMAKELNPDTTTIFHTDVQVSSINDNIMTVGGIVGYCLPMFGGDMKSLVGLPNSRIDISLIKNGFNYAGKIWYPKSDSNCFIYCLENKIIGINVKFK